jgi:Cohesin domain.
MIKKHKKQLKTALILFLIVLVGIGAFAVWSQISRPCVYLEPKSVKPGEEFTADVHLTALPEGKYPAASVAVRFDSDKLEFLGAKPGTLGVADPSNPNGRNSRVPEWYADKAASNRNGVIKAMYLDMSSGEKAYEGRLFEKGKSDILLRLSFKVKDTASSGDSIGFSFDDVCLAAVEGSGTKSLSFALRTLYSRNTSVTVH